MREYPKGTTINDRYVLDRKLGSDGQVYLARDRHLDTDVAVKILLPVAGVAQTWDEARRLKALESSALIPVMNAEVITNSDLRIIVTPVMDGGDLESLAAGTGLTVRTAIGYVGQIAAGISRIHADGMVHRDIKPANALLAGDSVIVSDLQFCEILDDKGVASRTGSFCTLAPEAAPDAGLCSILTDVYSLAATTFYLLSGNYPVDHNLDRAIQRDRIAAGDLQDLNDLAPHVPQSVRNVVRRGMAVDPSKRYQTVDDFAYALTSAMHGRRDWGRVVHEGHLYCVHGEPFKGRSAVVVCVRVVGSEYVIGARLEPSGRRPSGGMDSSVPGKSFAKSVRALVGTLST